MSLEINLPAQLATLTAACDAYEDALMRNDLEAMDALFWARDQTIRYGVGENLYGIDEIRAFRKTRSGGSPQRRVLRREITTYGGQMGTCNLEFQREGSDRIGRQSQTWLRTAAGWKVVAAHVSFMAQGS
ncbi:MAG: oxalurate catabolism protein HpxZ [Qingshengfaniella sp.]